MMKYQFENDEETAVTDLEEGRWNITPSSYYWQDYEDWKKIEGNRTKPKKPGPHHDFDETTWTWIGNTKVAKAEARQSMSCGPLQLRRALRQLGLLKHIKDMMKIADEETVEAWEYATIFNRLDPLVLVLQQAMGKTDEEVDQIFQLALTFQ